MTHGNNSGADRGAVGIARNLYREVQRIPAGAFGVLRDLRRRAAAKYLWGKVT